MVRFKNEDHAQVVSELDAEMAKMGFVDDGHGNFVPAPPGMMPAQVPATQPQPIFSPEPISQVAPVYPTQPTPTPQTQVHNWDKRESDAREAQRLLSLERNAVTEERQMLARERAEAMSTLQALADQRQAIATQAQYVPQVQQQVLTPQFIEEYPDIADAINRAFAASQNEINGLKQERQKEADATAIQAEQNRRTLFIDLVKREHPDYEAIIGSQHFQQWSRVQNRSTLLVLEETFNTSLGYEPSDLSEVITRYKRSVNPAHIPPPVPQNLNAVTPGVRSMDLSSEPSGPDDFVFSKEEMRDPSLIDRWMTHSNHRRNRPAAMKAFDDVWARSVAFHNR